MGRRPCCAKEGLNRGAWTAIEDKILTDYIELHGEGKWRNLPGKAGLKRCGKSCRLRWLNYLRPDIKRGNITPDEEDLIVRLHKLLGNRWSLIAGRLPGRTDNEIKNYWNTSICKKVQGHRSTGPNRKSLKNQAEEKWSSKTNNETEQKNTGPSAIRTKASRCTKLLINAEAKSPGLINDASAFESMEDDSLDFMMHAFDQMDEKFLSDFLHDDFTPLCDFDRNGLEAGDCSTCTSASSPASDQNFMFSSEIMLSDLDLHSMAALPDSGIEWLQDVS